MRKDDAGSALTQAPWRAGIETDAVLLMIVLLNASNFTATKYLFVRGWSPLPAGMFRYLGATSLFVALTYWRERSFRIARVDLPRLCAAGFLVFLNQLSFVYGLKLTQASTVALILGTIPIFVGAISLAAGLERPSRPFWVAAALASIGVGLIASSSGHFGTGLAGTLIALVNALTWAGYTVIAAPLLRRHSPLRVNAMVYATALVPFSVLSFSELHAEKYGFRWTVWLTFAYTIIGPLFLTNVLWLVAIIRVGATRAALFANLQLFFAVLIALALLDERLHYRDLLGGVLILLGIVLDRLARPIGTPEVSGTQEA